jgi:hypothetical protein
MYHKHPIADTYFTELVAAQHQKFSKLPFSSSSTLSAAQLNSSDDLSRKIPRVPSEFC